jgi:hypothetical protein
MCVVLAFTATLAACGGGPATEELQSPPATTTTPPSTTTPSSNNAPVISGTAPATVTAGQNYTFTPTAMDADQDKLTFTIANKPAWASFDSSTGRLSGTPAAVQAGNYAGIQIGATDGKDTATLSFAITVYGPTGNNSVTVSWIPPTQNTDGSAATLSGYRIYYGSASGRYTTIVPISNPGLTRYVIDNLPAGTYFFIVTAVSAAGDESDYSGEASRTVG